MRIMRPVAETSCWSRLLSTPVLWELNAWVACTPILQEPTNVVPNGPCTFKT